MSNNNIKELLFYLIVPFIIYIFITIIIVIISSLVFSISGFDISPLFINGLAALFSIGILIPMLLRKQKKDNEIIVDLDIKKILYMIPVSFSLNVIINLIILNIEPLKNMLKEIPINREITNTSNVVVVLSVIILIPIVEENIFRGFIFKTIKKYSSFVIGMILSSLMFGLFHGNVVQAIGGFICGIVLCFIYEYVNNIMYPIIFHILFNLSSLFINTEEFANKNNFKMQLLLLIICIILFIISLYQFGLIKYNYFIKRKDD